MIETIFITSVTIFVIVLGLSITNFILTFLMTFNGDLNNNKFKNGMVIHLLAGFFMVLSTLGMIISGVIWIVQKFQ